MNPNELSARERKHLRIRGVREHQPFLGPQTVHFDIANGCNVRCVTCWHHSPLLQPLHRPTAEWKQQQMSFDTFRSIFDQLLELSGLEHIILSGMGDPSLNHQLNAMVRYAHRHQVQVTIITNLLQVDLDDLLSDKASLAEGLLDLLVSVCGATPDVWHAFHAMPAGFDRLLGQLDRLREASFAPKHVQVINGQNFHELEKMVRFARTWPAKRVNFKFASLSHGTEACALTPAQKQQLRDELIPRARAVAEFLNVKTDLTEFATQIDPESHRTAPMQQVGCYMGTVYCRVTVDLELLYCCNTEVSVGHLTQGRDFRSLWLGDRYTALRQQLAAGQFLPSCEQCGKYKQNLRWQTKLGLDPPTWSETSPLPANRLEETST